MKNSASYLKDWHNLLFIGLMGRVFNNSLGDRDSIPGGVIPKIQKLD